MAPVTGCILNLNTVSLEYLFVFKQIESYVPVYANGAYGPL